jgi:hypothetical protein
MQTITLVYSYPSFGALLRRPEAAFTQFDNESARPPSRTASLVVGFVEVARLVGGQHFVSS